MKSSDVASFPNDDRLISISGCFASRGIHLEVESMQQSGNAGQNLQIIPITNMSASASSLFNA